LKPKYSTKGTNQDSRATWVTRGHKKNLRGAQTYGSPSSQEYKDNYERIFGVRELPGVPDCTHDYTSEEGSLLKACKHCDRPLTMDAR
jgi:hypothetical protein